MSKKPSKVDIGSIHFVHADLDPEPSETSEAAKQRYLDALAKYERTPTFIIDSGNGIQALWKLNNPVDLSTYSEAVALDVEDRSEAIMRELGAKAGTQNCDRILRVPGTTNLPNEKKLKEGREKCEATLLWEFNGYTDYDLEDFPKAPSKEDASPHQADDAKADCFTDASLPDDLLNRLKQEPPGADLSEDFHSAVCDLKDLGWSVADIEKLLGRYPKIIPKRYKKRLRKEINRSYDEAKEPKPGGPPPSRNGFSTNKDGVPYPSQRNIRLALKKLGAMVKYNEFAGRYLIEGLDGFDLLDDRALDRLWLTVDDEYGFRPPKEFFVTVVLDEALRNSFHPVRQYLDGLKWDSVKRIDRWLIDYGSAEETKYVRAVSALMLIAGVRRIRQPGCKFDEMPVLISDQGLDKSSGLKILAVREEWFSDNLALHADDKRIIESLRGHWIVEAAELNRMSKADVGHLKAYLSRSTDRARMSYDRTVTELKRQSITIGTTNEERFLSDQTGNRRYWPIRGVRFDLKKLRRDRDQLWAEAAAREAEGASIRLDRELWAQAGDVQQSHTVDEPWIEVVEKELGHIRGKLLCSDAWLVVGMTAERRTQAHYNRLGTAMRKNGWRRDSRSFGKLGKKHCYLPDDVEKGEELKRILVSYDRGEVDVRLVGDDDDAEQF
jgi:hypothetical protein